MNPWPVEGFEPDEVHLPRPGHADLVGAQKYGHADIRNVLERASARETAARVAAGTIARGFLAALGVEHPQPRAPDRLGQGAGARRPRARRTSPRVDDDPVRCLDPEASAAMVEEINRLRKANESLGGSFEVLRLRPRPRARLPHLLGRPARRPPRRRRRLDPVGQGRRDRRSLGRRRPARLGGPRRDLLVARSAATTARPTTPAASRAG